MIAFLIKSTLSMLVFLLFYKLVLEREKMHRINRFLLIFALIFSIMIPFVTFELISENPIVTSSISSYVIPEIYIGNQMQTTAPIFTFENILWSIYTFGFLVFLFRFVRNLILLLRRIHEGEKIKKDGFTLLLIQDEMLPHSFWNYVFVNRNEYENNLIDDELFVHEKAHITQKHSLDILFIEALQIIFWFNPLIYLYKKAIKLNHEFLADQKVNNTFKEVVHYQKLLLQKAMGKSLIPIASNLNYSITKKRFIMMTKNTPTIRLVSKLLFSMVLFLSVFFTFSVQVKAQANENIPIEEKQKFFNSMNDTEPDGFTEEQANQEEPIYTSVEIMPEYPGGIYEFRKFVMSNFKTPKLDEGLKGMIVVQFIIEKDGSLSDIKVLRDLGHGTGEEAVRVVGLSEKWKPGIQNGKPVRVNYTLPIQINIEDKVKAEE